MANNKSIQVLRGSSGSRASSSESLLAGQPFYEWDTNKFYIGGSNGTPLSTATPVNMHYDTVISNQAEFEAWYKQLDGDTYEGESVLFLNGAYTRSDGKGLRLPDNLKQIYGLGDVTISFLNFSTINPVMQYEPTACIYYAIAPGSGLNSIQNIHVECHKNTSEKSYLSLYGFHSCINLINCSIKMYSADDSDSYGFYQCTNLYSCVSDLSATPSSNLVNVSAFRYCNNLISCSGVVNTQITSKVTGFSDCTNLQACSSTVTAVGTGQLSPDTSRGHAYAFCACNKLNNCRGITNSAAGSSVKPVEDKVTFYQCNALVNCTAETNASGLNSFAYQECQELVNCTGYALGSTSAITFDKCTCCSNCMQGSRASSTATWGDNCTDVDPDTCPDYPDPHKVSAISVFTENTMESIGIAVDQNGKTLYVGNFVFEKNRYEAFQPGSLTLTVYYKTLSIPSSEQKKLIKVNLPGINNDNSEDGYCVVPFLIYVDNTGDNSILYHNLLSNDNSLLNNGTKITSIDIANKLGSSSSPSGFSSNMYMNYISFKL